MSLRKIAEDLASTEYAVTHPQWKNLVGKVETTLSVVLEDVRDQIASLQAEADGLKQELRQPFRGGFAQCRTGAQTIINAMVAQDTPPTEFERELVSALRHCYQRFQDINGGDTLQTVELALAKSRC